MYISEYFPSLVENGDQVYVWDGVKEPEQQTKNDMLPIFNYPNPDATTTTSTTTTTTTTLATTTTQAGGHHHHGRSRRPPRRPCVTTTVAADPDVDPPSTARLHARAQARVS